MLEKNKIKELQIWFKGNEEDLMKFYQEKASDEENLSLFWSKNRVTGNIYVHYGTPQLIANEIKDMLAPNFKYEINKDEKSKKMVDEFITTNYWEKFVEDIIIDLTTVESAFARVSYEKFDEEGIRIIERIDPKIVEELKIRNKVIGYDIVTNLKGKMSDEQISILVDKGHKPNEIQEETDLKLIERHVKGQIKYILKDNFDNVVSKEDYDLEIEIPENIIFQDRTFKSMFGVEIKKGSLRPSLRHFDAQDEIFSQQRNETRVNKRINLIPEEAILKDDQGNTIGFSSMGYNYRIPKGEEHKEDEKMVAPKMQSTGTDIDPEKRYLVQLRANDERIIINAGLDLASFMPSSGESAKSKEESFKRTLTTYKEYGRVLSPFFKNSLNAYFNVINAQNNQQKLWKPLIEKVQLEEYIKPTLKERIEIFGSLEAEKVISLFTRVKNLMPKDASDEEINEEVERIKKEQGIPEEIDMETEA